MESDLFERLSVNEESVKKSEVITSVNDNFHITIDERSAFIKALAHANSIVEKNNTLPILSNIKLVADNNSLQLTATNSELAISERVNAETHQNGALTVPAHTFYDIVRKLPDGLKVTLSADQESKGRLNIAAGNCKFSLPFLPADEFPVFEYGDVSHKFKIKAEELRNIIEKNRLFISTEETRYNLNGIFLHTIKAEEQTNFRAVAVDGHRLSRIELATMPEGTEGMPGIIIPRKTVLEAKKIFDGISGDIEIEISQAKIKFSHGDFQLISKLIDGAFPEYDGLIPYGNKKIMRINADHFAKAVDRVSTVTFEKLRTIKFSIKQNCLTLSAADETNGTAREELEVEYQDQDLEVGFNARYLLDVMSIIEGDIVEFYFGNDNYAPAIIKDAADSTALYVIMPLLI